MEKQGKITGISLGPGDPDLITVKGLRALQQADVVYYPGSLFASGLRVSYSLSILEQLGIDTSKCKGFFLEMDVERKQANTIYDKTALEIFQEVEHQKHVAIVSEGDLSTYSSFSYLLARLRNEAGNMELIPGITSYGLGAALAKWPLSSLNEKMLIFPAIPSAEALKEALEHAETIVLMKIRSVMSVIDEVMQAKNLQFVYGERLGTADEYMSSDWSDVRKRDIPYFSLMIIKR